MRVPEHRVQLALLQVPHRHHTGAATCSHQGQATTCTQEAGNFLSEGEQETIGRVQVGCRQGISLQRRGQCVCLKTQAEQPGAFPRGGVLSRAIHAPVLKDMAVQALPVRALPSGPPREDSKPPSPAPDAFLKLESTSSYRTLSSTARPSPRPTPTMSSAGEEVSARTGEPLGQGDEREAIACGTGTLHGCVCCSHLRHLASIVCISCEQIITVTRVSMQVLHSGPETRTCM